MLKKNKHLIVVVGPTAVGKTACCIKLAEKWQCDILSADARQFYREMSIGTAKPTPAEQKQAQHHFIDFLSIHQPYNAARFEKDAIPVIKQLLVHNDRLLMTGGSGLYIQAICQGLDPMPDIPQTIYQALHQKQTTQGLSSLVTELSERDPIYYKAVDRHNPHRIIRALAVCRATGKPLSSFRKTTHKQRPFHIIKIGLLRSRNCMRQRAIQRVDTMIQQGLIQEARQLYNYRNYQALQTIGYKELFQAFEGKYSLEQSIEKIKIHTCQYIKRQMSFFRADKNIHWFAPEAIDDITNHIKQIIAGNKPPTSTKNNESHL